MDGTFVVGIGIGINAIVVAFGYGILTQKVKNLENRLKNGFTCSKHAELEKEIGRLQGAQDKRG